MSDYRQKLGRLGEDLAAEYLTNKGFIVVQRNLRLHHHELDLLCRDQEKLVFVEVKSRTSTIYGSATEQISQQKLQRLKVAINHYCQKYDIDPEIVRLDFVALDFNRTKKTAKIYHFKNIF